MELTRIITVQITAIAKIGGEKNLRSKDSIKKEVSDFIKGTFDADDVTVLDVQDFIMD